MKTSVADLLRIKGAEVQSIAPDASVYDVVKTMDDLEIGSLIVLDGKRIAGIVTEHDCRRTILEDLDARKLHVSDIMTRNVLHVEPATTLEDCMALMTEKRIRHLPVMDRGRLAGLVSIGDVVKFLCTERGREIENLEKYITGSL